MLNRVLLIVLTSVATCGLETAAIARPAWEPVVSGRRSHQSFIISQLDSGNNGANAPQPSPAIQSLQNRLTELGYYEGPVDGVFSAATRDALAAFQRDNDLVGTGVLDPLTQERLVNPEGATPTPESAPVAPDAQGATPEAGAAPSAPSSALDLPPVSESGEVDASAPPVTDENAESPTASPEVDATGEAAAGEAAGEETAPAASAPDAETEASAETATVEATESSSRLPLLIGLGALIIIVGGVGTGIILWLAKRRSKDRDVPVTEGTADPGDDLPETTSPPRYSVASPPPPPPPSSIAPEQNGKQPADQPASQSSLEVRHQSMPITNPAEPRVAKVNIIDELIQDLHRPDPELRRKAIWELGQRGNSAAIQPLVNLLTEADSHEQSLVLAAIAEISSQTLKPMNRAIAIALQNENSEVRKNAIRDLTRVYDSLNQVGRMLGHAAIDEDPEVRQTADWALGQLRKMRLNATDTAALLKESDRPKDRLPEDESSSSSS